MVKKNLTLFLKCISAILVATVGLSAFAYIPDYQMILSRTAENHGRGTYEIEQEVVFPADPEPLRVKETWVIKGENDMAVTLTGLGPLKGLVDGRIVYDKSEKYFTSNGQLSKSRLTDDWWMPFFHFRFSKSIKSHIIALKMAPASSLQDRKPHRVDQKLVYPEQSFMRLSRTGGAVNYAIGTPAAEDAANQPPGLWIQQDQFVVRKIRLPSQTLIKADDYFLYSRQQWLPKKLSVEWDQSQAQIILTRVDALTPSDKRNQLLTPKAASIPLKLPEHAPIREFYQRYR